MNTLWPEMSVNRWLSIAAVVAYFIASIVLLRSNEIANCTPDPKPVLRLERDLFLWYNTEHHHTALGLHTPENVHYGRAALVDEARQRVLVNAYENHPERFVKGPPRSPAIPTAVWINPPSVSSGDSETETEAALH